MSISPARTAAFDTLLQVEQKDSYASELLHSPRYSELSAADHGLAEITLEHLEHGNSGKPGAGQQQRVGAARIRPSREEIRSWISPLQGACSKRAPSASRRPFM